MREQLPGQEFISLHDELKVSLGAHRELGPELDDAIVEAFLERAQRAIDARVDMRLRQLKVTERSRSRGRTARLVILLAFAIPLSAIGAGAAGINGLLLVLAALVFLMWID
ncbi:MAG: hypothetical protein EPO21_04945 [Chloroflexota bacterium]|nr:MAG: hypothetical protein EPO21_04945 [Chloroflexota bacterium]